MEPDVRDNARTPTTSETSDRKPEREYLMSELAKVLASRALIAEEHQAAFQEFQRTFTLRKETLTKWTTVPV